MLQEMEQEEFLGLEPHHGDTTDSDSEKEEEDLIDIASQSTEEMICTLDQECKYKTSNILTNPTSHKSWAS